ncbi:AMP-binding protein [Parapusillimonas granuli]|mgnify:CR=1 FL=1|uniref:Acyl--CoA ligase n=1 Tax=Parapusillimonas granuli TaxID=380911 RepID=A0A853FV18_9BURK|nr:AMP-binding protein [Parapusillimonas granuli]MBB5213773.1 acyl-CoA synthetase (AMP-forming)/AMP-acid ligase II [Parapusillimonas granuli]MEB2398849.1 AMP-binding protein [Alcaligenaceae bacterium]NYT48608.1 acyl--CoA ligase [Parapusillimonas granuli]
MLTLDFLKNLAERHGNEIALEDDDVQVSYAELATAVNALAVALQMKDPALGSRVALCAANSLEYLVGVLAVQAAGKVPLPLSHRGDADALHALLLDAQPTALIVDDAGAALIQCDEDLKIHISQFAGLVHTYRDHTPDREGNYPAPVIQPEQSAG